MLLVCSVKKYFPFKTYIELIFFFLHYIVLGVKRNQNTLIHQNVKDEKYYNKFFFSNIYNVKNI